MLYRAIIFTNVPLLKGYKYRDKFQLVPFSYFPNAPFSRYAKHFPAFIEYEAEEKIEHTGAEQFLLKKGIDEKVLEFAAKLPNQVRVRKEILLLLTCLTNYRFFEYSGSGNYWGIPVPHKDLNLLSEEELHEINRSISQWIISCYTYPEYKEDLQITKYTQCSEYYDEIDNSVKYFTRNPVVDNCLEITFAAGTEYCLDRYYQMKDDLRNKVRRCTSLLADGVELFNTKRSLSLISLVSSIEGMALIDYEMYGETPNLGAKNRFIRYLKRYVAGKSEDKYKEYYKKRCDIAHEGFLMIGDVDIYSEEKVQAQDWRMRLEILQLTRMSLHHWLRRKM